MAPVFQVLPHLVRNAIDHGVEPVDDRADKPEMATLRIQLTETEADYRLLVQDDGRGIDVASVVATAVARGALSQADAGRLSARAAAALIFRDGVSTARNVTEISGRGVGMSAVKSEVERLGGEVQIETELGKGTKFVLRVPKAQPGARASVSKAEPSREAAAPRASEPNGVRISTRPLRPSTPPMA
jgi:two-component system chemotaxis sensor kinase CheA